MKIQRVEIYNFRNFYGKHNFNLDKNITILYGENGYGKSTFFDAIEWCLTNEIERFKGQDGEVEFNNYDCLNNAVKGMADSECYVSIHYDNYCLLRRYNATTNRTNVTLYGLENGREIAIAQGQKNVESKLYKYKDNQENRAAKLIKQSYVLSQDQITNFIRSNPRERFDSLASIMGINKVTNFIDNLKTTNSLFLDTYENLCKELESNKQLIASHVKEREESEKLEKEISDLLKGIETLDITSSIKDFNLNIIDAKIEALNLEVTKNREVVNVLKEIPYNFSKYNDLKVKQLTLENEYKEKINLITRAEDSKVAAKRAVKDIDSTFKRITEQKNLLTKSEKKRSEIKEIRDEINKTELGKLAIEELQHSLIHIRKKLQAIDYTLLYIDDYQKAEKDSSEIPATIIQCENDMSILERKIRSRRKLLLSLEKWLNENNASSSLQGLIQYLQGISNYVKNNDVQGTCPVCSSHVGDSLETEIHENINYHTSQITELELQVVKAYELQERVEKELNLFQQEHHKINLEVKKLKRLLDNASNILNNTSQNKQFNLNLFNRSKNENKERKIKLKENILEIENIVGKKSKLISIENDYKAVLESLNLKKSEGSVEKELEFKKRVLNRKLGRLDKLIEKSNLNMAKIKQERDEVSLYIASIDNFEDFLLTDQEFHVIINQTDKKIKILENDFSIVSKIKELSIKKNEKKEGINRLLGYEEKEKELETEIKGWNEKIVDLEEYIKSLTTKVGEHALDFLNQPHSKIQQYYRYLNPMPTTNGNIHFVTDNSDETKRGLSITIPYEKDNGEKDFLNARYTLSSAQLNTLAIAIFLVANDSQDVGIFDFVAIDDPIQNMDDVNQYTMCDILGDIDKQLLFSTHDLEFLKLFIKKNEYKKQDIRVYFLETPNLIEGRVKGITF